MLKPFIFQVEKLIVIDKSVANVQIEKNIRIAAKQLSCMGTKQSTSNINTVQFPIDNR